jgi:hypothetical protein
MESDKPQATPARSPFFSNNNMSISKAEAKQILEGLIFDDTSSKDWVQDVWALSPFLGDSAAKLLEAFEALIDCCPEEKLENLLQIYSQELLE